MDVFINMKYKNYTEEQRLRYLEKAREYKKLNKEILNEKKQLYMKDYYKNLSLERLEQIKINKSEYQKKNKIIKPPRIKKEKIIKPSYRQTFIERANSKHNNKYDYSKSNIINSKIKILIICPIHNEFMQTPNDHLTGCGCPKCGGTGKLTTNEFIERANSKHNNKYDYSLTQYIDAKSKVKIICSNHGVFEQKANNHLDGKGCKKCGVDNGTWHYKIWATKGLNSINFDSFKVYIIECWNDTERFYKIGKTFKTINDRFNGKVYMPYSYKIVKLYEGNAIEISKLEQKLQSENKKHSYKPLIKFNGMNECFLQLIDL